MHFYQYGLKYSQGERFFRLMVCTKDKLVSMGSANPKILAKPRPCRQWVGGHIDHPADNHHRMPCCNMSSIKRSTFCDWFIIVIGYSIKVITRVGLLR